MIDNKIYDALMLILAFVEIVILAFLIAALIQPTCLDTAYLYSMPTEAIVDEQIVKTPMPGLKHKTKWHEARIAQARE